MVRLLPVRGWHPDPSRGEASRLVSPVYDTLGPEDHRRFDALPHNAATFTSRRTDLPVDAFLVEAKQRIDAALASGAYLQDAAASLYIYAIGYRPPEEILETLPPERRRPEYLLLGLVGALPEDAGRSPDIALHERTFSDRVEERARLTERTGMSFAPIVAGYTASSHALNDLLEGYLGMDRRHLAFRGSRPPLVEASLDGAEHRLWRLEDPEIASKVQELLRAQRVLILDGHHRFTAARRLQERGRPVRPLAMVVEAHDVALLLLPWHRVLPPTLLTYDAFLAKAKGAFPSVEELPSGTALPELLGAVGRLRPQGHRGFLAVGPSGSVLVTGPSGEEEGRDFEILHHFLESDLKLDAARFSFVRSPREAVRQARADGGVAFLLPPLSFRGVEQEAFADRVMAQKSTMFLPKVAEGVLFAPARPS